MTAAIKLFSENAYDKATLEAVSKKIKASEIKAVHDYYANGQKSSKIINVKLDDLYVQDYQRHTDEDERKRALSHVKSIFSKFDTRVMTMPLVTKSSAGQMLVIDGAHRVIQAKLAGVEEMSVHYVETANDEAALFVTANTSTRTVSSHSKARALAMAEEENFETLLTELLACHNLEIRSAQIGGVSMAKRLVKAMNLDVFEKGIELSLQAWPEEKVYPEIAAALGWLADLGIDEDDIVDTVSNRDHKDIFELGDSNGKGGHNHGFNRVEAIVARLIEDDGLLNSDEEEPDHNLAPWLIEKSNEVAAEKARKAAERDERRAKREAAVKAKKAEALVAKAEAEVEKAKAVAIKVKKSSKTVASEIKDDLGHLMAGAVKVSNSDAKAA